MTEGARVWLIPDGYLPERSQGDQPSHEAICVLNTGVRDATLRITFYFEDRPPLRDVEVQHSRLDTSATALALMTTLAHPVQHNEADAP